MDDPVNVPPPPPASGDDRGTLAAGFGAGCAVLVVGPVVSWGLMVLVYGLGRGSSSPVVNVVAWLAGLVPLGLLIGAVVYFLRRGQTRSALGVLAALLAMFAVGLLLLAACFGVVALSGGGSGWH
jgi:hypothetical protein